MSKRWIAAWCGVLCATSGALQVRAAPAASPAPVTTRLQEKLLTTMEPVEGGWRVEEKVTISGRVFDTAATMDTTTGFGGGRVGVGSAVFQNRDRFDLFEAWIGFRGGHGKGTLQFKVRGDGEELYLSPRLGPGDPPLHISVPIRGCGAFTLAVAGEEADHFDNAVWGSPTLVRLPPFVTTLVSPGMGEQVHGDTPLMWKPVEKATGYLLELQCERATGPTAPAEKRFLLVSLPAGMSVWTFIGGDLPKGRWRWRVHTLSPTGFLGEMERWGSFVAQ